MQDGGWMTSSLKPVNHDPGISMTAESTSFHPKAVRL